MPRSVSEGQPRAILFHVSCAWLFVPSECGCVLHERAIPSDSYHVPEHARGGAGWYDWLEEVSHPYDALLLLLLLEPSLFDPKVILASCVSHTLVGMQAEQHGVPWPERVHDQLVAYMRDGLKPYAMPDQPGIREHMGARAWLAATGPRLLSGVVFGLVVTKIVLSWVSTLDD